MCHHVIVLEHGAVRFEGPPADLARVGDGRVWIDEHPDPGALRSWRTPDGLCRHIGDPPPGATTVAPTIEDGYLLLTADRDAVPS